MHSTRTQVEPEIFPRHKQSCVLHLGSGVPLCSDSGYEEQSLSSGVVSHHHFRSPHFMDKVL
eukprot:11517430-Ditylum_brightwellii.AAC.1